ncbi:MAG: NfeD family protein [Candidatus Latescibacterota bacterium]
MEILTIILLVACGFILLVIEAFLVPGFSVPGIAGIVVIFFGIYRALNEYGVLGALITFLVCVGGTALLAFIALRSRTMQRAGLDFNQKGYCAPDDYTPLVGKEGTTLSPLRPAGIAIIGGERVDVVTDGEFLEKNTPIRVLSVEGARVIVTRTERE